MEKYKADGNWTTALDGGSQATYIINMITKIPVTSQIASHEVGATITPAGAIVIQVQWSCNHIHMYINYVRSMLKWNLWAQQAILFTHLSLQLEDSDFMYP